LVREIARVLRPAAGLRKLCCVAFGTYQRELTLMVPDKLRVVFYRRLMFAVANAVAVKEGAKALVTGESLGQVASQTLDNIRAVDAVAEFPVLRPLIGTDKQEIIDEARRLGTFELSTTAHDDCCTLFMPRSPETHAKLHEVDALWVQVPVSTWVAEILADMTHYRL
jgi:thiamine biosynthesis protein ThiI